MTIKKYILKNWKTKTIGMMVDEGKFSYKMLRKTCKELGIDPITKHDMMVSVVIKNCEKHTAEQIAGLLKVTVDAIYKICRDWDIKCISESEYQQQQDILAKRDVRKSFWDRIRENGDYEVRVEERRYSI
jgi:hypothetical protein